MSLDFKGSPDNTIGVEIELQLINPSSFDLTGRSKEILKKCKEQGLEKVKAEIHQSMIEINGISLFNRSERLIVTSVTIVVLLILAMRSL